MTCGIQILDDTSPDGLLRFIGVIRYGDISLGFDGFTLATHADSNCF